MKTPTVADVLLSQIALWGIRNIYGVAGDAIIPLLDAIGHQDTIRYFAVRHETAAAIMASTEGKCTSRIGVSIGTSGPGLANMLNGIADAAADHVPMLVITGQVPINQMSTETKQYIDQQRLIDPLTVFTAPLLHPDTAITIINQAIIAAIRNQGVAHVSIPKDVLALPCTLPPHRPTGLLQVTRPSNMSQLDQSVKTLSSAAQPMILIGQGARGASTPIAELATKMNAGIIETLGAKGIIPADHELNLGGLGEGGTAESSELLKQSDCVLIIGANWYPESYVPSQTQVIKIDLAPGNIESQQNIAMGIVGDVAEVVNLLNQRIPYNKRTAWSEKIRKTKENVTRRLDEQRQATGQTITPQALIAALEQSIADDAIIALDTGDHTIWFNRIFRAKQQTVLFSGKWRTMGYGLPAAISSKLQYPDKEVTALVGDGSFLMTAMELSTIAKYQLPIKIIVANNVALAAEKTKMIKAGIQPYGVELTNPNFSLLASSFGIHSVKVDQFKDLANSLRTMYSDQQAVLMEVSMSDLPSTTGFEP